MGTFSSAQCFALQTNGFTSDTVDGEVIIVNLNTGVYYSLTDVAAEVWHFVQSRFSFGQIVEALHAQYQEDRAKISDWIGKFLGDLQDEAILVPAFPGAQPSTLPPAELKAGIFFQPPQLRKYTDLRDMVVLSRIDYTRLD